MAKRVKKIVKIKFLPEFFENGNAPYGGLEDKIVLAEDYGEYYYIANGPNKKSLTWAVEKDEAEIVRVKPTVFITL